MSIFPNLTRTLHCFVIPCFLNVIFSCRERIGILISQDPPLEESRYQCNRSPVQNFLKHFHSPTVSENQRWVELAQPALVFPQPVFPPVSILFSLVLP